MLRGLSRRQRTAGVATLICAALVVAATAHWAGASDHRDSALLTANPAEDIADVYTFDSPENPNNLVLAMTVSGFIPPAEIATAFFDPDVLYQIKIDKDGDAVEDLVIQAFATGSSAHQVMHFRGPVAPSSVGGANTVVRGAETATVRVSHSADPIIAARKGIKVFAGVRDDPFFFDLVQFNNVVSGAAASFNNPGADTFAGFNVLAIVIELPKSVLGDNTLGVWGTTSRTS